MSNSYYFRRRTIGRAAPPYLGLLRANPLRLSSSSSCDSPSEDEHSHSESDSEDDPHDEEDLNMDLDSPTPLPPSSTKTACCGCCQEGAECAKGPEERERGAERMYTLRPILTIQRSQGFVWNQDLFVPPYIKDRYVASTSPPNSRCFIPSTSASSTNSAMTDYEVEVVEIRVREGELRDIIP
ncbi:hypothetical protein BDQ17DRAFT_1350596 [Cyathus striatus]|nr:hypothetical protein BDQ17DRAFT_1350596 [Cyathus striatus]